MATSSGVAPHRAFLNASGGMWPIEHGTVVQNKIRETSAFNVDLPLEFPGAFEAFSSGLNSPECSVFAEGPGGSGTLIDGLLASIKMDFISGTIMIGGTDKSILLGQSKITKKYTNQPSASIISDLVASTGLSVAIKGGLSGLLAGKQVETDWIKLADNTTPAYVIHKLCEFEGAIWWVKNGTFNVAPIGTTAGSGFQIHVERGPPVKSDCELLVVTYDVFAGGTQSVLRKSWYPPGKKLNKGVASKGGRLTSYNHVFHDSNLDVSHLTQWAKGRVAEIAKHALTVEATCVGDPNIDIGAGLSLSGTGVFDDSYEIDKITHVIGYEGYTMDILAKTKSAQGSPNGNWGTQDLPVTAPGAPPS